MKSLIVIQLHLVRGNLERFRHILEWVLIKIDFIGRRLRVHY